MFHEKGELVSQESNELSCWQTLSEEWTGGFLTNAVESLLVNHAHPKLVTPECIGNW
jgi:hypothetical protein